MSKVFRTLTITAAAAPMARQLAAAGVPMTLVQAQGLLSQATVSERPFAELAAELDLVPLQGDAL